LTRGEGGVSSLHWRALLCVRSSIIIYIAIYMTGNDATWARSGRSGEEGQIEERGILLLGFCIFCSQIYTCKEVYGCVCGWGMMFGGREQGDVGQCTCMGRGRDCHLPAYLGSPLITGAWEEGIIVPINEPMGPLRSLQPLV
jgi:hypothetical protein